MTGLGGGSLSLSLRQPWGSRDSWEVVPTSPGHHMPHTDTASAPRALTLRGHTSLLCRVSLPSLAQGPGLQTALHTVGPLSCPPSWPQQLRSLGIWWRCTHRTPTSGVQTSRGF